MKFLGLGQYFVLIQTFIFGPAYGEFRQSFLTCTAKILRKSKMSLIPNKSKVQRLIKRGYGISCEMVLLRISVRSVSILIVVTNNYFSQFPLFTNPSVELLLS